MDSSQCEAAAHDRSLPPRDAEAPAVAFCVELAQALARAVRHAEIVIYLWRDDLAVLAPVARAVGIDRASRAETPRAPARSARPASDFHGIAAQRVGPRPAHGAGTRIGVPIRHEHALLGLILADLQAGPQRGSAPHASLHLAAELAAPRLALLGRATARLAPEEAANEAVRDTARDRFEHDVREALRRLHDATRLRHCALARSARVAAACRAGDDPGLTARRFLLDALDAIAGTPDLADQGRLLRRRFVERAPSQVLLAEALHLGGSTLRRHVQRATALLASLLWQEELAARSADRSAATVDGGPRYARPAGIVQSIHASPASSAERADSSLRSASPQAR
jgi:hypothetical protein